MGRVFEGIDTQSGQRLAIKVLIRGENGTTAAEERRFAAEAELLEQLAHPAIVRYVAHGATLAGEPYLAMEWLDGETLAARLSRGSLSLSETIAVATRTLAALTVAHEAGVIHRDLKPSNLLLVDGDPSHAKLIDFGVAHVVETHDRLTRTGAVIGTPGYMAPEQARGGRALDGRADLFSVGCVMYECLTGRRAFAGTEPIGVLAAVLTDEPAPADQLVPELPHRLSDLVSRLLAKQPEQRPPSAARVSAELATITAAIAAGDQPTLAADAFPGMFPLEGGEAATVDERPPAGARLVPRGARRRGTVIAIAAGAGLAGLATLAWFAWGAHDSTAGECTRDDRSACVERCAANEGEACFLVGEAELGGSYGFAVNEPSGDLHLRHACELGVGRACMVSALRISRVLRIDGGAGAGTFDRAGYEALLARGCDLGFYTACRRLARDLRLGENTVPVDLSRARALLERGCGLKDRLSCRQRAELDPATAQVWLRAGCALHDAEACARVVEP